MLVHELKALYQPHREARDAAKAAADEVKLAREARAAEEVIAGLTTKLKAVATAGTPGIRVMCQAIHAWGPLYPNLHHGEVGSTVRLVTAWLQDQGLCWYFRESAGEDSSEHPVNWDLWAYGWAE